MMASGNRAAALVLGLAAVVLLVIVGYPLLWLILGGLGLPAEQPLLLSVSQAIALAMVALGVWGLRRR